MGKCCLLIIIGIFKTCRYYFYEINTVKLVSYEHVYNEFSDIAKSFLVLSKILKKSLQNYTVILNSDKTNLWI